MIKLVLEGKQISTQHLYGYRVMKKGKKTMKSIVVKYMKKEGKALKEKYIRQINSQYFDEIKESPVSIKIKLVFGDKRKRDWDNRHKVSMDALEGTVLENDCQIIESNVKKTYEKGERRIEMYIYDFEGPLPGTRAYEFMKLEEAFQELKDNIWEALPESLQKAILSIIPKDDK